MVKAVDRWGGAASLVAGILWLLIWAHQQEAHGRTEINEMRLVGGLTWMDTSKLLVPIFLLVFVGLASLYRRREQPGRLGRVGAILTFGGLGLRDRCDGPGVLDLSVGLLRRDVRGDVRVWPAPTRAARSRLSPR